MIVYIRIFSRCGGRSRQEEEWGSDNSPPLEGVTLLRVLSIGDETKKAEGGTAPISLLPESTCGHAGA